MNHDENANRTYARLTPRETGGQVYDEVVARPVW